MNLEQTPSPQFGTNVLHKGGGRLLRILRYSRKSVVLGSRTCSSVGCTNKSNFTSELLTL